MSRCEEKTSDAERDRLGDALDMAQPNQEHQPETSHEEQAGTDMAMMAHVCGRVTDDANQRRHEDHQPFQPLVNEVLQSEEWQKSGDEGQEDAVHGACDGQHGAGTIQTAAGIRRRGRGHAYFCLMNCRSIDFGSAPTIVLSSLGSTSSIVSR